MAHQTGSVTRAWKSHAGRKAMWAIVVISFGLVVLLGSFVRDFETTARIKTIEKTSRILASSVLVAGEDSDDILFKVSDLLNVETVKGVRLHKGSDIPLSVGETDISHPDISSKKAFSALWDDQKTTVDVALRLDQSLPFDWIVLSLDADKLAPPPFLGTLINWVAAPIIALINALICLWVIGNYFLKPLSEVQNYLQESNGKYALSQVPPDLCARDDESGLLAKQIETMRQEVNEAKVKADFQARFLHETPYPLLRCSVNRKVLFSNAAAKSEDALFGDETKEFVSPALSELVRKALIETKQVRGDIRCPKNIISFRAIPVLDQGYVNLYGEESRKPE